ncbi:MAG: ABC transporter substrate-binding protein, partial [Bacteroidales bacterium]|nr:ABC transporter substrate-binding protein [Bacteroidales bacterium]
MRRNIISVFLKISSLLILLFFLKSACAVEFPNDTIKIGLLISEANYIEARSGAELAISEINRKGGLNNTPLKLVTRSMEGPWGTGANQTVDLVFNEKVWAIVGSNDGRNTHLAEQVIAKTHVAFISAWSGDPTLYQAFVPWFFSIIPNNIQQAVALVEEIYYHQKIKKVMLLSDEEYDSETEVKSFLNEVKKNNLPEPIQINYENINTDFNFLFDNIKKNDSEVIVIFGQPQNSLKII